MAKYALITGGAGFIGAHIARNLLDKKIVDKVVLLDHFGRYVDTLNSTFYDYRKLRFIGYENEIIVERGDSKYFSVVSRILRVYQPDYIFHMAALPLAKLPNLNTEEAREGSVDSTSFLLETIGQLKREIDYSPKRFVYASSSMVILKVLNFQKNRIQALKKFMVL
jgi:nucleoside-diphosphate-sugar epimerase